MATATCRARSASPQAPGAWSRCRRVRVAPDGRAAWCRARAASKGLQNIELHAWRKHGCTVQIIGLTAVFWRDLQGTP